jgi:hypothetical protein
MKVFLGGAGRSMGNIIFINYRRSEDKAIAGRLHDRLEQFFEPGEVFLDVEGFLPGQDFVKELLERVSQCDIFIAVIGEGWMNALDDEGNRRLDAENDWVRIEIESALKQEKWIIPVLIDRAVMPPPKKLPTSMADFSRRNAVSLRHERFRGDVQVLGDAIHKLRAEARNKLAKEAESQLLARRAAETVRSDTAAALIQNVEAAVEEKRKAEAAEAKRKADEAAEMKRQAEAAEAKRKADEAAEVKRQAEAAEAKRKADEAAAMKRQAEAAEAKRKADEAAAVKRQAEAVEATRMAVEEERRREALLSPADRRIRDFLKWQINSESERRVYFRPEKGEDFSCRASLKGETIEFYDFSLSDYGEPTLGPLQDGDRLQSMGSNAVRSMERFDALTAGKVIEFTGGHLVGPMPIVRDKLFCILRGKLPICFYYKMHKYF